MKELRKETARSKSSVRVLDDGDNEDADEADVVDTFEYLFDDNSLDICKKKNQIANTKVNKRKSMSLLQRDNLSIKIYISIYYM